MSQDLQLFDEKPELAIAPDDDMGVNEQTMPTVAAAAPVMEVRLEPETAPLMQILPADFRLPVLTRFIPNPEVKARIDKALTYAKSIAIEGQGQEALTTVDAALSELNAAIARGEAEFKDPAEIAFELHRHVTGTRGAWVNDAKAEVKRIGNAVWRESNRLKEEAAREQRRLQDEANAKARAEADAEAARAAAARAPAPVIEKLQERARTAVAPPVAPLQSAPLMTDNSVVTTWRARLASTPEDADELAPALTSLSKDEQADVLKLFAAIAGGRTDLLSLVSVNFGAINKLAVSQESTFNVPGFVAFKTGGTRKKAQRVRR